MSIIAGSGEKDFEKVKIDEWITGEIDEVQERKDVEKQFTNDETGELETRKVNQVRFKFKLEGYEYKHYSRWNTLSTNENSNLYKHCIQALFGEKYPPNSMLNIEKLKGVKVKTMWDEVKLKNGRMFQFVSKLRFFDPEDANRVDLLVEQTEEEELQELMDDIPEEHR